MTKKSSKQGIFEDRYTIFVTEFMRERLIICIVSAAAAFVAGAADVSAQFAVNISKAQALYRKDTVTICVMGDMMMHSAQIADADRGRNGYDFTSYFKYIKDKIAQADIAIANMEFTLAGEPYTGYPAFSAPDCYAEYLADCGFDIFLCANNHIFDKGSQGAARTIDKYRELGRSHGIRYCGLAADPEERQKTYPLITNVKGINIAILNFTYGTNLGADMHWPKVNYMNDKNSLKAALEKSSKADFTIVLPHWGTEYELAHSLVQRKTAEWLVDNGADMIIGTHPHVVQDCERIDNVQVAYSLGNAVSNMSAANTQIGLMATIRSVRKDNGDILVEPLEFTWLWCSRPGGWCETYCVIPIEEFIGSRNRWKGAWEYDKMIATYDRVRRATGIN